MTSQSAAVPAKPPSPPRPEGVFVAHEGGEQPIRLVGWRGGERRSRVISEIRALGLIQQLAQAVAADRAFRLWDETGIELGMIQPRHALTIVICLADAVRERRAAATRRGAD